MNKLIYIIGSGRSGTTLLDILLGNAKDSFSAGELNRFTTRNGIPPKRDESSLENKFWRNVREKLPKSYFDRIDS